MVATLLERIDDEVGSTRSRDLQELAFAWDIYGEGFTDVDGMEYNLLDEFLADGGEQRHAGHRARGMRVYGNVIDWVAVKEQLATFSEAALQRAYRQRVEHVRLWSRQRRRR
jgi:hypothetical protein